MLAPPAVKVEELPVQTLVEVGVMVKVGFGFTVMVIVLVLVHPPKIPVTV